ncbi:MAG TPA: nuclear transport factor 2 family protein [Pyrinomonadaceae bacterium]|nr:nuclear transport factor 2 family protein [Pyrinomonadaceae bacterium]
MKRQYTLIVWLLAACTVIAQTPEEKRISENLEQEILKVDGELLDAIWRADVKMRERIADDALIYTTYYGSVLNKAEWIAHVGKSAPASSRQIRDDLRIRISGDTAIVSGRVTVKIENPHSTGRIQSRYTNVYVKRQGEWKLIAAQVTEVKKQLRDFYNIDKESGKP